MDEFAVEIVTLLLIGVKNTGLQMKQRQRKNGCLPKETPAYKVRFEIRNPSIQPSSLPPR